jgi:Chromosome segregation ATPases
MENKACKEGAVQKIMDINDIYKSIRPLKNRMHMSNAIRCMIIALGAAGIVSLAFSLVSFFVPIPYQARLILLIYISAFTAGLVVAAFLRPGNSKTMAEGDKLGLKERLVTAEQLKDEVSPIARMQRYDALKCVSNKDFRMLYRLRVPRREALVAIVLAVLTVSCFFIPSHTRQKAYSIEHFLEEVKKQADNLEEKKKELADKSGLSKEKLKEIDKKIDQLTAQLKKSKSEGDALKALSMAKHELDKLKNRALDDEMKELAERLVKDSVTRDFGNALKNGDFEDLKQKSEELNEILKKLDDNGKKQLAEEFAQAAREVKNNGELAKNLSDIGEALASGKLGSLNDKLASLDSTLSALASSDNNLADNMKSFENEVINQLAGTIDDSRREIGGENGDSSLYAQGEGQEGSQQGAGDGQGNGEGNGNGTGSSSQNGGGGAGKGSTDKDAGYSDGESGGASRETGDKNVKDYENIYVPERLGDGGNISQVNGAKNNSGQSQLTEAANVPIEKGSTVPYDKVLEQYRSEALNSIGEYTVPPVMKDIVRDYFSSLD